MENLAFQNLTLTHPLPGKPNILNNLSSDLPLSALTALYGPTGSGKTSLLNALAFRLPTMTKSSFTGSIRYKDQVLSEFTQAGYVTQEDHLYSTLTVKETLQYAYEFQNKGTKAQRDKKVNLVLNMLGLVKVQDDFVGGHRMRGVSGGEKKRVCIGVELMKNPAVLFLDEPTSGLDSFQALSVISALKGLTRIGMTVVLSVHQPRSAIVSLFDHVLIVTEGSLVYSGGNAEVLPYFASMGYICPRGFNSADFLMDTVSIDYRSKKSAIRTKARVEKIQNHWHQKQQQQLHQHLDLKQDKNINYQYKNHFIPEFISLFHRNVRIWTRNTFFLILKIIIQCISGCLYASIYSYQNKGYKEVQDKSGLLFFVSLNQAFSNMGPVINLFSREKVIINKERQSGSYRLSTYYFSKILSEIPNNLIGPLIYGTIVYFGTQLNPGFDKYLTFLGILTMEVFCAIYFGLCISAIAGDEEISLALLGPLATVLFVFAGQFIKIENLPEGSGWVASVSFVRWTFQALMINQWKDYEVDRIFDDPIIVTEGEDVLELYHFDKQGLSTCVYYLFFMQLVFVTLGYVILRFNQQKYMKPEAYLVNEGGQKQILPFEQEQIKNK